jgi:hypothetical protein
MSQIGLKSSCCQRVPKNECTGSVRASYTEAEWLNAISEGAVEGHCTNCDKFYLQLIGKENRQEWIDRIDREAKL